MANPLTIRVPVADIRPVVATSLEGLGPEGKAASLLVELLLQAQGPALDDSIAWLTAQLRQQAAVLSNAQVSILMRLIAHLDERREEAELAANPERRAGIERVAGHFARKAQSGWAGYPLPEVPPSESDEDTI